MFTLPEGRAFPISCLIATMLIGTLRAEKLHWVEGGSAPQIHTLDLANIQGPITVQPITNLPSTEHVIGLSLPEPFYLKPIGPPPQPIDLLLYTEDINTLNHRLHGLTLATAAAKNAKVLNEDPWAAGSNFAGYQFFSTYNPLDQTIATIPSAFNTGKPEFRVAITRGGDVFSKASSSGATPSTYVGSLGLADPIVTTSVSPRGRILVLTVWNTTQLHIVRFSELPGLVLPLTVTKSVSVTYPPSSTNHYSQVTSIAMAKDKKIYALLNFDIAQGGHSSGKVKLCSGKIIGNQLNLSVIRDVDDYFHAASVGYISELSVPMVIR